MLRTVALPICVCSFRSLSPTRASLMEASTSTHRAPSGVRYSEKDHDSKAPIAPETIKRVNVLFVIGREINGLNARGRLRVRQEGSRSLIVELDSWLRHAARARPHQDEQIDASGGMGGHKPKAVSGEHAQSGRRNGSATVTSLRGLVAELAGRALKVDSHLLWDVVHAQSSPQKAWCSRTRSSDVARRRAQWTKYQGQWKLSGCSSSTRPGPDTELTAKDPHGGYKPMTFLRALRLTG